MTTGKINYSPDYKSEKPKVGDVIGTAKIVYSGRLEALPVDDDREPEEIERTRLERAVIDLAKKTRAKGVSANCPSEDCRAYYAAVDDLVEFEQKQK